MTNTNLTSLSVAQMRAGLLDKSFSSVELVDAHLDRVQSTNPELNSFITVCSEQAKVDASAADAALSKQGKDTPVLTGIPVGIKDMLVTKGVKTTCASKILENFVPPYQCSAVNGLTQAGAVMLGKLNQDEFAMGSSNENSAAGPCKNPADTERVPGGSSGGSAVAVASGQVALSLGTDTGGSIRQPAAFTGIYGLKPTYGRVSRFGAVAFASSLDQIGPFARNVEDLALCMNLVAGHDECDSTSLTDETPDYLECLSEPSIKGMKIGIPTEYLSEGLQPEIKSALENTAKTAESLGAEVVEISLPHTKYSIPAYYVIAPAEASSNLSRYDGVRYGRRAEDVDSLLDMYEKTRSEGFGDEVKRRILIGNFVLSSGYYDAYYQKAQKVRRLIQQDFVNVFDNKCDVILTPTTPTTAFKLGEKSKDPVSMYLADIFTVPASLAGIPGLNMPVGQDSNNLPIGLQLLGKPLAEETILKTAKALSTEIDYDTTAFTNRNF